MAMSIVRVGSERGESNWPNQYALTNCLDQIVIYTRCVNRESVNTPLSPLPVPSGLFWATSILGWAMNFGYHMSTISNPSLQINTKYEMVHNVGNALIQVHGPILGSAGVDIRINSF